MSARFQEICQLDCRRYLGSISGDMSTRLQEICRLDCRRYVGLIAGDMSARISGDMQAWLQEI